MTIAWAQSTLRSTVGRASQPCFSRGKGALTAIPGHAYARRCFHPSRAAATSKEQEYSQEPLRRDAQGQLLSRVSGPRDVALSTETLGAFWRRIVQEHEDRPALIVRHEPASQDGHYGRHARAGDGQSRSGACIRWTYGDMEEHIQRLMHGLQMTLGVRRGDRVAVLMMNNAEMAALQIATARVGAILVTLNPSYTPGEILRALNQVQASCLFSVPALRTSNYLDALKRVLPSLSSLQGPLGDAKLIEDEACPSLRRLVLVDNLTDRPRGWESESTLAINGYTFHDALSALNGRCLDYRDVIAVRAKGDKATEADLTCSDIVNLQLTSGTTGSPKAVALSSRNLVNNGMLLGQVMKLTSTDILAVIPPLFHCFGLVLGNLAAWSAGAAVVYAAEGFHPVRALRAVAEERATALHGVPAHFIAELDVLRQLRRVQAERKKNSRAAWPSELADVSPNEDWSFRLRTGFTSGSTVPIELMRAIMDDALLGAKQQTVVYGMTETSPVSFACDTDASVVRRCQTVGRVAPHVEAKIVAPDDQEGKPLPVGHIGELCTAGYIVMDGGYWDDPEKTAEALQRHPDEPDIVWMRTGDLAKMDAEGYTEICGRVKDLIIRGGENISAVGIENCIDMLPGVAGSAVVAVPDTKMGETVGVFLQKSHDGAHESTQDLSPAHVRAHVKGHLAGHCAPDYVWHLGDTQHEIPAAFPTTASGKVQKVVLRAWAKDLAARGVGYAK